MSKARIKLASKSKEDLTSVCSEIKSIAQKSGVEMHGPIPLPTKHFTISTRKTPCGDGSDTYEKWDLRVYKRLIELSVTDEKVLYEIMKMRFPSDVQVQMNLNT